MRDKKHFWPFGWVKYDEIADFGVFRLSYVDKVSMVVRLLVLLL